MRIFKCGKMLIVCDTENMRSGFKHTATLCVGGFPRSKAEVCWVNRTWERFTYESVMLKLIDGADVLSIQQKTAIRKKIHKLGG